MNPFLVSSLLNQPLSFETCQAMIFSAATTTPRFSIDSDEDMLGLRDLARMYGREVYILNPSTVEQLFQGMTLAIYQEVQRLFCSSVFRSHRSVWSILSVFAAEAHVQPPSPEAIWAMCGYLSTARDERVGPAITQSDSCWYIGQVQPDVVIAGGTSTIRPEMTCIIDEWVGQVQAFGRTKAGEAREDRITATLYDALSAQRQPASLTPGGLTWSLPKRIVTTASFPQDVATCCAELDIAIESASTRPALINEIQGTWSQTLSGRVISAERFDLMLDTYLKRRHGHGPRTTIDDADYAFHRLDGYNRDPALMLPPLRWLLPAYAVTVDGDGAVTIAGRRYYDNLLRYWSGASVTVRVSRHDPHLVYVYLNGETLCVASQAA